MNPEKVKELYTDYTNLDGPTPEEQREAIIGAMKPAVFLTQPDTAALQAMASVKRDRDPRVVGVRGMLPPNKLGERNIKETFDPNVPEKITLDKIPPEQLVFYNQKLKDTETLGGRLEEIPEDERTEDKKFQFIPYPHPIMNVISNYQDLYEQGVVPQPGYFPTQEHYDRYQANRQ
tara:strand:- start:1270 stop:1797 length:528 start_codon:yes stop_codon:yes gene_type:complete